MNIRKIEEKDLEALVNLFVSVFNSKPWSENWTKEWAYERLNIIFNSYRFYGYIAEVDDIPFGAVFSRIGSYKGELELEVLEMFVSNQQQRQGIGAALLDELKLQSKKYGIVCVVLQTDKTTFAKDFYLKYGFKGHDENLLMTHVF
jgi:ribosomal protein S18 acetylase RimI-like enzyme